MTSWWNQNDITSGWAWDQLVSSFKYALFEREIKRLLRSNRALPCVAGALFRSSKRRSYCSSVFEHASGGAWPGVQREWFVAVGLPTWYLWCFICRHYICRHFWVEIWGGDAQEHDRVGHVAAGEEVNSAPMFLIEIKKYISDTNKTPRSTSIRLNNFNMPCQRHCV